MRRLTRNVRAWEQLYEELGLDCIVVADHASPAAVDALVAAGRNGVAAVVLANSWKDVYAHPYVAAPPTRFGVAASAEADYLRRAGHLSDRIAVVGSLHLERFLKPSAIAGRAEFCGQAGLDDSRPFICYTAAAPRAFAGDGEDLIVEMMLETIEHHRSRPQVLLRLNPREDGERFRRLQPRFPNLVIQKPCWEWNPREDWNAPLPQDLDRWVATVHHAAFNVSIPSTVTLEFSAVGRLTLNICFDTQPQPPEASNARFWEAPFYQRISSSPFVAGAFSEREFRELLTCRLDEPGAWKLSPARGHASPVDEAQRLVGSALAALGKAAVCGDPSGDYSG